MDMLQGSDLWFNVPVTQNFPRAEPCRRRGGGGNCWHRSRPDNRVCVCLKHGRRIAGQAAEGIGRRVTFDALHFGTRNNIGEIWEGGEGKVRWKFEE